MAVYDEEDELQQQIKRIKTVCHSQNRHSILTLPSVLVIEILLKLRVKCLLRCKSVRKSWYSLISDPQFVKSHLTLSTSHNDYVHHQIMLTGPTNTLKSCPLYDVMHDKTIKSIVLEYPLKEASGYFQIVGYCHGFLCIKVWRDAMFICNPSTRRYNKLPDSEIESPANGFGYDESSKDYKVVVISERGAKGKIYSLNSGKWKKVDGFPFRLRILNHRCKFSNGALHWVVVAKFDTSNTLRIVSFDLATETYGEVKQPVHDGGYEELTIGALGECLCLLYGYGWDRVDVWVMKVYGVQDSWTKLVSLRNLSDLGSTHLIPCFTNDGKILFQCGLKLVLYDVKNGTFSKIKSSDECSQACTIVESLVSPVGPRRRSKRLGWKSR